MNSMIEVERVESLLKVESIKLETVNCHVNVIIISLYWFCQKLSHIAVCMFLFFVLILPTNMIENALERFSESVFLFVTGKSKELRSLLVKKHNENLQTHGDFSFPNSVKSWHGAICDLVAEKENVTILQVIGKEPADIVEESKKWNLRISKVKEEKGRIYLYLERPHTIYVGFSEALRNYAVLSRKIHEGCSASVQLDPCCRDLLDLTSLRAKYVCDVIKNICALSEVNSAIFVSSKSSSKCEGHYQVFCGTVLNSKTGAKETDINANTFIRLRQDEMSLIAQHKYGVRVSTDSKWKEFITHLGESAAAFELLQTKPSGAVKINFDCSSVGSSKGASFILYNCARLETIIRTYNDKVVEGIYPVLPQFDDVDFSLLTQEDEWHIIFNYILGLPSVLTNCVEINDKVCEFRPHHICSFLCSMVRVFSQYYRRIRILVEPRKHLLPVIYARIHMLKILNETLKTCLTILNIKSVSQM